MAAAALVGLVFVSHSEKIAGGLVELAAQMAPNVALVAAGGTDDGGIGTSLEKIQAAIGAAQSGAGVIVLCDLGSAIMTAESAIEFLGDGAGTVSLADAPLVEGGVAAAVAAETGGDLDQVLQAAQAATGAAAPEGGVASADVDVDTLSRTVTLVNKDGLHARPAADFVKLASTFDTAVTVNGVDAKSLLGIMALGLTKGSSVTIATADPSGLDAVSALAELISSGFGEQS